MIDWNSIYWITQSLAALPAILWIYFGLGIPYAMALLPQKDWRQRILVLAVAFAVGPALLTAWMLILGVLGANSETHLLQMQYIMSGTIVLFLIGMFWAIRKWLNSSRTPKPENSPLALDEKILIFAIIIALILRWLVTAYYPFTAYDSLWVYGFQPRLYLELGYIPHHIDYYPQFVQLQYTFAQLGVGGVDDHAARAIIPFMHLGSIFAAYVLGQRLFNRRVGISLAAIWALYPHVGDWAHVGDLEIPLTFLFTLTSAFFLLAWFEGEKSLRRRYALLAGVIFGIAMWTKPTAGAFIWSVALVVVVEFVRVRFNWRVWLSRFEVAFLTGIACIPLGSIWYLRNILLGHHPIDLPPTFWLTQARQSGDLFGWWLLALGVLLAYLYLGRRNKIMLIPIVAGVVLILAALLPSMPLINPMRFDPPESRLTYIEWGTFIVGCGLLVFAFWQYVKKHGDEIEWQSLSKIGWSTLIAIPYFITWFISYSYHYRLVFAIVPLMILPTAVILAHWIRPEWLQRRGRIASFAYAGIVLMLAIPGTVSTLYNTEGKVGWLWGDQYPDDDTKYRATNPSIMLIADKLRDYQVEFGEEPVVVAPGEQRLHFFFPTMQIDFESVPTQLDELEGATHYIYGALARIRYDEIDVEPAQNQIVSSLARRDIMIEVLTHTDATFSYELYQLNLARRSPDLETDSPITLYEDQVIFGDVIQLWGVGTNGDRLTAGNDISIRMFWQALEPLDKDYLVSLDLINLDDGELYYEWDGYVAVGDHGYYATYLWDTDEYVLDRRAIQIPEEAIETMPTGTYQLYISIIDPDTGEALPMTVDGQEAGTQREFVISFGVG